MNRTTAPAVVAAGCGVFFLSDFTFFYIGLIIRRRRFATVTVSLCRYNPIIADLKHKSADGVYDLTRRTAHLRQLLSKFGNSMVIEFPFSFIFRRCCCRKKV